MKPWLFFDFDGTLLDIRKRFYNLYVDCLQELGGFPLSQDQYWNFKQNKSSEREILRASNNEILFEKYDKNRLEQIESIDYLKFDTVWPDFMDKFIFLRETSQMSIVTLRKKPSNLDWQIDHLGLTGVFSHVICSGETPSEISGHEIKVNLVRNVFGKDSFSGWFFGDTEVDILAGKVLGMKTCAVGFGLRTLDILKPLQPDVSIESPERFLDFIDSLTKNPDR